MAKRLIRKRKQEEVQEEVELTQEETQEEVATEPVSTEEVVEEIAPLVEEPVVEVAVEEPVVEEEGIDYSPTNPNGEAERVLAKLLQESRLAGGYRIGKFIITPDYETGGFNLRHDGKTLPFVNVNSIANYIVSQTI